MPFSSQASSVIRAWRAALALLLAFSVSPVAALAQESARAAVAAPPSCTVRVTLLQVNDVYQFLPVERGKHGGLARVSTLRKQIMKESPHTLFLMSGDTISPSVESITYQGRQMIDAWNAAGLDLAVFGNHEFDFGPEVLLARVAESRFKWLGANVWDVKDKANEKLFAATEPYVVREFGGVKVGVFGLTLPATKTTSRAGANVEFRDSCATARQVIPKMRAAGANTIVALTHLSMSEDKQLARCAPEIDVIIGGHEHTLLQSHAARTPIFKMAADARDLGRIELNINAATGKVESIDWEVIHVNDTVADDPEFNAAVTDKYQDRLAELSARVGETSVALDARSEEGRTRETNIASFIADAFRTATGADVALINGGSIRADTIISPGEISLRDVLSILPFGNDLAKVQVKGTVLRAALEHGVSRSAEGTEPGEFPQVSGIRFTFDASLPVGSRVKSVTVNAQPLDDAKTYTLATTAYVANGGDGYEMLKGLPNVQKEKVTDSGALRAAIAGAKSIAPQTDGRVVRLDKPSAEKPCPVPTPAATPVEKKY